MADLLWHSLEQLPAEEALLDALKARWLQYANLPHPSIRIDGSDSAKSLLVDLSELKDGSQAGIEIDATAATWSVAELLPMIERVVTEEAKMVLFVPYSADWTIESWMAICNKAGWVIEQWRPFYSAEADKVARSLRPWWSNLLFETTGQKMLPWRSLLEGVERKLRPFYEEDSAENSHYLAIIAHKQSPDLVEQQLPPAVVELPEQLSYAPQLTKQSDITSDPRVSEKPQSPPINLTPFLSLALGILTLFAGWLGYSALKETPLSPRNGLIALGVAVVSLIGFGRIGEKPRYFPRLTLLQLQRSALYAAGLILSWLAFGQSKSPLIAFPLWIGGSVIGVIALIGSFNYRPKFPRFWKSLPLSLLIGTLLVALIARYWGITTHPFIINGSEAQIGLDAINVRQLFGVEWLTNPSLSFWPFKLAITIFGRTVLGVRVLSPLIGTVTVLAAYKIGRTLWNPRIGLLAAMFLAGSHFHLHYSRLGMTNIWEPLCILLTMGSLAIAWETTQRRWWIMAGIGAGISAYFFTSVHLLPLMLVGVGVWALLFGKNLVWRNLIRASMLAFLIALPQIMFYRTQPNTFMERADRVGIQATGWLASEQARTGESELKIWGTQFWNAALGFTSTIDKDATYKAPVPLVSTIPSLLFLLGVGYALLRLRDQKLALPLITLLITVIFGGMLLLDPPHSRRFLLALPMVCLLGAVVADLLLTQFFALFKRPQAQNEKMKYLAVGVLGTLVALSNYWFYFGRYAAETNFADRNSEIAFGIGNYLNTLDEGTTVYLYGAPALYSDFSTIPYLAPQFTKNSNIIDVIDINALPPAGENKTIHIYVPERSAELGTTQTLYPGGTTNTVSGKFADPLFVTYESP